MDTIAITNYCYFCREEIKPNEKYKTLHLYTWIEGHKQELIAHTDCIEGDFRKGEE